MTQERAGIFERFQELIRRSLAARLITIAAVSVLGLMAMGWVAYAQFNAQMLRLLIDPELESVANDLTDKAGPGLAGELVLRDLPFDPRYLRQLSGYYYQIARVHDDGLLELQVISPSLFDVGTSGISRYNSAGAKLRQ